MNKPILYADNVESFESALGLCSAGYYVIVMLRGRIDAEAVGRRHYDFQDTTLLFLAPCGVEAFASVSAHCSPERMLAFDPSQFGCTALDRTVCEYAFFHYHPTEMLHLAACEQRIVIKYMQDISREAACREDYFSCRLLSQQIRLLLDHCVRMYERQFITREQANRSLLARYATFVTRWIESGRLRIDGEPSEEVCAAEAGLSPAYFRSLLQFEKGCKHTEYVQRRRIEIAKRLLMAADKTICEIASLLGFSSEPCFSRFFKKITNCLPGEYRRMN